MAAHTRYHHHFSVSILEPIRGRKLDCDLHDWMRRFQDAFCYDAKQNPAW